MQKPTSCRVVLSGSLLIVLGVAGCRAGGQTQNAGSSLLGDRGGPGRASESVISREPNQNPYPSWSSRDSNGYLQPSPAPPSEDSENYVPPSPLGWFDRTFRRNKPVTQVKREVELPEHNSGRNVDDSDVPHTTTDPASAVSEPVESQLKLMPEVKDDSTWFQRMGTGFRKFASEMTGPKPHMARADAATLGEKIRERRLAARLPETDYEPFSDEQYDVLQARGESSAILGGITPVSGIPLKLTPAVHRNPIELGRPESF